MFSDLNIPTPRGAGFASADGKGASVLLHQLMEGVESRFGIKPGGLVERKLDRVMGAVPLAELENWVVYMNGLAADHPEWQSLVESLTVHETYFYREPELMRMVHEEVFPHLLVRRDRERQLKIWSAACSTGEEAYDLAYMALRMMAERGKAYWSEFGPRLMDGWSLSVLGTDISNQVLRTARSGVYSNIAMGSIRNMPPAWMDMLESVEQPLDRVDTGERYFGIRNWLKSHVSFSRFNLIANLPPVEGQDLVFCRNVLIYFEDSVKRQVQTMLARAIAPGGTLVLGSAVRLLVPEYFEPRFGPGGAWYVRNDTRALT